MPFGGWEQELKKTKQNPKPTKTKQQKAQYEKCKSIKESDQELLYLWSQVLEKQLSPDSAAQM